MTERRIADRSTAVPLAVASSVSARGRSAFRWQALAVTLILIIEYLIGAVVNLFVSIPATDHGAKTIPAIVDAISSGPLALALHTSLGLLLIVLSLALLVRSVVARRWALAGLALLGLLSLVFAALAGAEFVGNRGGSTSSMVMASLTAVALSCYLLIGYLPEPSGRSPASG
jgi:hypothetical protein